MRLRYALVAAMLAASPAMSQSPTDVFILQMKLNDMGYEAGEPDGQIGPNTRRAITEASATLGVDPEPLALMIRLQSDAKAARSYEIADDLSSAVTEAVSNDLLDPFSAQYRDMYRANDNAICGQVNAKNGYGAYTGWKHYRVVVVGSQIIGADIDGADRIFRTMCLMGM